MTKNLAALIFCFITIFNSSCRKIDTVKPALSDQSMAEKFLTLPATANPELNH